jgi:hypothetical protein
MQNPQIEYMLKHTQKNHINLFLIIKHMRCICSGRGDIQLS